MMERQDGFTLLEIMVALVVFGLLLAGLTQGIHYGLRAWQSQVRIAGDHDDLDAVDRVLRQMIEVMDPGRDVGPAPFAASQDQMVFVSVLPDGSGLLPGGIPVRHIAATLLVTAAHQLVLRWRPSLHAQLFGPPPLPVDTALLSGVSRLELSFWRRDGGWINAWQASDLPTLIRIRAVFPQNDPRHWTDIVVAPVLNRP